MHSMQRLPSSSSSSSSSSHEQSRSPGDSSSRRASQSQREDRHSSSLFSREKTRPTLLSRDVLSTRGRSGSGGSGLGGLGATEIEATAETHGLEAPMALPLAPNLKLLYTQLASQSTAIHTLSQNISTKFTQLSSLLASLSNEDERVATIASSIEATVNGLEQEIDASLKESQEGLTSNMGVTNRQKEIGKRLKNVQDELKDSISGMEGLSQKAILKEEKLEERRKKARRGIGVSTIIIVLVAILAWLLRYRSG